MVSRLEFLSGDSGQDLVAEFDAANSWDRNGRRSHDVAVWMDESRSFRPTNPKSSRWTRINRPL